MSEFLASPAPASVVVVIGVGFVAMMVIFQVTMGDLRNTIEQLRARVADMESRVYGPKSAPDIPREVVENFNILRDRMNEADSDILFLMKRVDRLETTPTWKRVVARWLELP